MNQADPSTATAPPIPLVQRVAEGDEAAAEVLYQTYAAAVFRFVYCRVGEHYEEAEEITQDTFLSALSLAPTYDGSCPVFTWLCGIAQVRLADYYRRQSRAKRIPPEKMVSLDPETLQALQELSPDLPSLEDVIQRLDTARLVDVMMGPLTEDEREVLQLRYAEEFTVREIAALMHRSEKAIESLLMRAKKKAAKAAEGWV